MPPNSTIQSKQQGVVLLEAMIAILIFSMGILAVVGLQAAMIKNTASSKYRADASYIAQQEIGRIWASGADPASLVNYVAPNQDISAKLPGGTLVVVQTSPGIFTITVTWLQPGQGETQHNFTAIANVVGG